MTHPLSIKFKPATIIRYGWSGIAETMESILTTWKGSPNLRNVLREAPIINEDWSSGVKVVKTKNHSIILELDDTFIKEQLPISGKMVPTTECGEYVAASWEQGEYTINIYFTSKDGDKRICLYSYNFCCK